MSLGGQTNPNPILEGLYSDVLAIAQEITAAETEDALYVGGLVKSLIAVRLQILRTTRALLEQRIHSLEAGVPITIGIPASEPDAARAETLDHEIQAQERRLQESRTEASRYTGGLVYSLKLSTIATHEQTMAMLRQNQLIAKYGLGLPAAPVDASTSTQPAVGLQAAPPLATVFEIIKIDARVTETNRSWSRYAWQLTVQNLSNGPLQLQAKIEFLDKQGFIIADHTEYGLLLSAGSTNTFSGNNLITATVAGNVRTVSAKLKAS